MTIREILEKINKELKENFDKPVITLNKEHSWDSGDYDFVNGRGYYGFTIFGVKKRMRDYIPVFLAEERNKILLLDTDLVFICKSKKSGIITDRYRGTDHMIVVSVELANPELLDKDVEYFIQQQRLADQKKIEDSEKQYREFKKVLNSSNLSLSELKSLYEQYDNLNYHCKKKADIEL